MTETTAPPRSVTIWDLPTRLFHWLLVALVTLSYVTAEFSWPDIPMGGTEIPAMKVHLWSGYAILTLLLFRVAWGFGGSSTARFSTFVKGPAAMWAYGRGLFQKSSAFMAGHNPLGAAMVVVMLLALLVQAVSGLFTRDEDDYFDIAVGPLNGSVSTSTGEWFTTLHEYTFAAIELLILVHIAANLFYWLVRREDLIGAMFTGRKRLPPHAAVPTVQLASWPLALALLLAAAALVWGIIKAGAG